ncbi:MAG: hypothetical protein IJP92_13750 [Lachnospiraceae bacterium]|nr:hypothetical protein [Lachnospiraceae bacterium]
MKKTLLSALLAASCIFMAGCGAQTETTEPANTAETTQETPQEAPQEANDYGATEAVAGAWYDKLGGIPVCLELHPDGSYSFGIAGEARSREDADLDTGSWIIRGDAITLDKEEDTPLHVMRELSEESDDEEISFEQLVAAEAEKEVTALRWPAMDLTFTREAPYIYEAAEVVKDAALTDLEGYWACAFVESEGIMVDAYVFEEGTDVYIEGEQVILGGAMFGDVIVDFKYADGALSTDYGQVDAMSIRLMAQEDGLLRMTLDEGTENEMALYFEQGFGDDGEGIVEAG